MRIITVFSFFILFSLSSFAGGGESFRYKVSIKLTDKPEFSGYIYFSTPNSVYDSEKESITEFCKQEFRFPVKVYKEIKTVDINVNSQYDFSSKENVKTIQLSEISEIKLIEKINCMVGMQRIFVLTEKEWDLIINQPKNNTFVYNEKFAENCSYLLLSWSDNSDLNKIKNEIDAKLREFVDRNENNEAYKYIKTVKEELLEKSILIIQTCGSM